MPSDHDTTGLDDHSVELAAEPGLGPSRLRRTLAALSVAICLAGAGAILVLAGVRTERTHEAERATAVQERTERTKEQTTVITAAQTAQPALLAAPQGAPALSPPAPFASALPATTNDPSPKKSGRRRHSSTLDAPALPSSSFRVPSARESGTSETDLALPSATSGVTSVPLPGESNGNGNAPGAVPSPALPNGSSTNPSSGLRNDGPDSTSDLP
jgi:hypothetical protein